MDRPELREKIARKTCPICDEYNFGTLNCELNGEGLCEGTLQIADQIQALFDEKGGSNEPR